VSPPAVGASAGDAPAIPGYLEQVYRWAYVTPRAVETFEREWLVNAILFGNYARLRDAALDGLGPELPGLTLQVACVYGNLTGRLVERLAHDARLDVVDILPIQLDNLRAKLPPDARVTLRQADASALPHRNATVDRVLLFFLLHEQPEAVRRATLAEAMRVVRPGGRIVIVDYHPPRRGHPMRGLMRMVFRKLEPYAIDLWEHPVEAFLPPGTAPASIVRTTYFGGLYQKVEIVR